MSATVTFNDTGSEQTWTVPAGVTSVAFDVRGAQGGYRHNSAAGRGARVTGTLPVTPGQVLRLWVGRMGATTGTRPAGGWPDGGAGGSVGPDGSITGCGGGGSSAILPETLETSGPYIMAGGGGGEAGNASYTRSGGSGGRSGTDGQLRNGAGDPLKNDGGRGGTGSGSTGGAAGGGNATAGSDHPGPIFWEASPMRGGKGSDGQSSASYEEIHGGGGGGGGWGAGGGGGPTAGGGGGGSGIGIATAGLTGVAYTTGYEAGDGQILLTYNSAPTAPGAFTSPTAGEEVDSTDTVAVSAATDAEGDTLTYEWDLSLNNGASYTNRRARQSGTSWTFDYSALAATTTAKWRVRAWDGTAWGPYRYSSLFTIYHNTAPNPPAWVAPASGAVLDRAAPNVLDWSFSDPDSGDAQSKFSLLYRLVGAASWTTVTETTTRTSYTIPANTLAAGNYETKVRTYDKRGAVSAYSALLYFTMSSVPTDLTITAPASGATIGSPDSQIDWSTPDQQSYQLRRVASDGTTADPLTIYSDTGEIASSTARNAALTFETNNRTEAVQLRIKAGGLWSAWSTVHVNVAYTPPVTPLVTVTATTDGDLLVVITHPTPTVEPAVERTHIYRRTVGDASDGTRIAVGIDPAGWTDRSVCHRGDYEYLVRAVAATGAYSDSDWST